MVVTRQAFGLQSYGIGVKLHSGALKTLDLDQSRVFEQAKPNHEHTPDSVDIGVRRSLNEMQEAALAAPRRMEPSVILGNVLEGIESEVVRARFPKLKPLKKRVKYARRRLRPAHPTNVNSRNLLVVPDAFKVRVSLIIEGRAPICGRCIQKPEKKNQVIVDAVDGFHPQALHVDFEIAMIKDLQEAFPSAGI